MSVKVAGVTVSYPNGNVALRDATFGLAGGSICALVGVNGSGKSTLFKAIMGIVEPAAGAVTIAGRPVREALKKNLVAYVPQAEEVESVVFLTPEAVLASEEAVTPDGLVVVRRYLEMAG